MPNSFPKRLRQHICRGKQLLTGNQLWVSLWVGDPEQGGRETTYIGYTELTIPRNDAAWVSHEDCEQAKERLVFPEGDEKSHSEKITHWGLSSTASPDAESLLLSAPLTRPIVAGPGVSPSVRPQVR